MICFRSFVSPVFLLSAAIALSIHGQSSAQETTKTAIGQFPGVEKLPASRFQDELKRLSPAAQKKANEILQGIHFNIEDAPSMHAHKDGSICFACRFAHQNMPAAELDAPPTMSEADLAKTPLPVAPLPVELQFNSRPGSPNVLWLNFEGQEITGTAWNDYIGRAIIKALPFSTDNNFNEYSAIEQTMIKQIWQRVAEDYAPFDINVTTQSPPIINNRTAICLITSSKDADKNPNPAPEAGGVAYVNVFGNADFISRFSPAFVYHDNLQNRADFIVDAASHEVGHNMGLSHDGLTSGAEYYPGHGVGDISWGPIMGTGYNRNVTQWSKGEYFLANNKEDDLAITAAKVGYRPDDHAETDTAATPLVITDGTLIVSTDPGLDPDNTNPSNKGVIEQTDDVDVFSFSTGSGAVLIQAKPWTMTTQTKGGNLDILLELYDDSGNLLQSSNPLIQTNAIISSMIPQGNYFLRVKNTGAGSPSGVAPNGYTAYGSLGQYFLSGTIVELEPLPPVLGALMIDDDAMYTISEDVILNHTRSAGIPDEYRASENADFSGATWQPYSSTPVFTLGGYGVRTVYFQIRNELGDSVVVSDTINYPDPTDPPVLVSFSINNGEETTNQPSVILNHLWTAGLPTQFRASENSNFEGAAWQTYAAEPSYSLLDYGTRTVYFQIRNSFGTSTTLSYTIKYPRPASIEVSYGKVSIVSGYKTPSAKNGTEYGTIMYGDTGVSRTFTVTNGGESSLGIQSVVVPVGFILTEGLPDLIAPGESDTFTVQQSNTLLGTNMGQIRISNADAALSSFQFTIRGIVLAEPLSTKSQRPVAYPALIRTFEDKQVAFRITGQDAQEKRLSFRIMERPKKGQLIGKAPNLVYVPDLNANGRDSFTFEVDNGFYTSIPATVQLVITPVNDPPVAKSMKVKVRSNMTKEFRLMGSDVDSRMSSLRFKVIEKPKSGSLRCDNKGKAVYIPEKGFVGSEKFMYQVLDGKSASKSKSVILIVK